MYFAVLVFIYLQVDLCDGSKTASVLRAAKFLKKICPEPTVASPAPNAVPYPGPAAELPAPSAASESSPRQLMEPTVASPAPNAASMSPPKPPALGAGAAMVVATLAKQCGGNNRGDESSGNSSDSSSGNSHMGADSLGGEGSGGNRGSGNSDGRDSGAGGGNDDSHDDAGDSRDGGAGGGNDDSGESVGGGDDIDDDDKDDDWIDRREAILNKIEEKIDTYEAQYAASSNLEAKATAKSSGEVAVADQDRIRKMCKESFLKWEKDKQREYICELEDKRCELKSLLTSGKSNRLLCFTQEYTDTKARLVGEISALESSVLVPSDERAAKVKMEKDLRELRDLNMALSTTSQQARSKAVKIQAEATEASRFALALEEAALEVSALYTAATSGDSGGSGSLESDEVKNAKRIMAAYDQVCSSRKCAAQAASLPNPQLFMRM